MFKRFSILILGGALLLSACGAQGTPTLAPVDISNTAFAAAFTNVAQTQEAIPTNTPVPPTETPTNTPEPTFTAPPPPTLEQLVSLPTATQAVVSSDPNNCIKPLNIGEAGALKRIRIENLTDGSVNFSLNLWTPNAFGQCGALSYTLQKNGKINVSVPVGSYYGYAWITLKNGKTSTASGSWVINQGYDDLVVVRIGNEVVTAH
ncbi:MAG: hypothetical protein IT311_13225 [Anaerolineales bacterium]|nr:hypothetical protein [Anaerolineales bacterium]MCZ2121801.1 hypothetical protein [Anaerolineales bacterium]